MVTLTQLKTEQLQARKEKNAVKSALLTTLLGEIQNKVTAEPVEKRTAEFEQKIVEGKVKSFLDQNKDAQGQITDEVRLAELKIEQSILSSYMPQQLSVEEIKAAILAKFPEVNEKNKGPIVGYLKKTFGNSVDGALAGQVVASLMAT